MIGKGRQGQARIGMDRRNASQINRNASKLNTMEDVDWKDQIDTVDAN
jgi:hypothetical protein